MHLALLYVRANDGAPAVTIVKTFVANKTTTEVVTQPSEDQS